MIKLIFWPLFNWVKTKIRDDFNRDREVLISGHPTTIGMFTYGLEHISVLSWGSNNKVSIGRFCSISFGLKLFVGGNHRTDWLTTYPFGHIFAEQICVPPVIGHPSSNGGVVIGNDVWVGQNVTILSGVQVGDGAVIAANSTVVSDVSPYSIVGGNPARFIRNRFSPSIQARLVSIRWWDYPVEKIVEFVPYLCSQDSEVVEKNLTNIEAMINNRKSNVQNP